MHPCARQEIHVHICFVIIDCEVVPFFVCGWLWVWVCFLFFCVRMCAPIYVRIYLNIFLRGCGGVLPLLLHSGLERKLQEERSGLLDRLHDIVLRIKSGQRLELSIWIAEKSSDFACGLSNEPNDGDCVQCWRGCGANVAS